MRLRALRAALSGSPERFADRSPVRLVLTLAALVFVAEAGVMWLLPLLPPLPAPVEALLDSTLLTTLISPPLYLLVFRPMRQGISQLEEAARALRAAQEHRRRAVRATDTLYSALRAARGALDEGALVQVVADVARSVTDAELGAVAIREPATHRIRHFATSGVPRGLAPAGVLPEGRGLLAPLKDGEVLRSDDAGSDPRSSGLPPWHPPIRSFLGVPVTVRGQHWGEIYVANAKSARPFGQDEELSLRALATFAGSALEQGEAFAALADRTTVLATVELATGIAHEINNGVASVRLNLQGIHELTRAAGVGTRAEDISQMTAESVEAIDRVAALIQRVRDAAGARHTAPPERVNVGAVARRAVAACETETPGPAPIAVDAPAEAWLEGRAAASAPYLLDTLVRWFRRRVAADPGERDAVRVRVHETVGGGLVVAVGHGTMPPPAPLETVFDPAVRPTAGPEPRMELDLDLLLVRAAVLAAGARIAAVPGSGGRGFSFRVEFPGDSSAG